MQKLRRVWRAHWRFISGLVLAAIGAGLLLLYKLGSLAGGLSDAELQQRHFADSWHHIAHDPLGAPLSVIQWLFLHSTPHPGQTITRLGSSLLGLFTLVSFGYVLRRWYGIRTALFGTVIFGCSAWFLHVSRYAGTEILYLWAMPTLLAAIVFWERHSRRALTSFAVLGLFCVMLYVPGLIWLIAACLILQPRHLTNGWRSLKHRWQRLLLVLLCAGILTPLLLAIVHTPSIGQSWLGLPAHFTHPAEIPRRLAQCVGFLVWRGPLQPALWLDRMAILDIFSIAMALLGIFFYSKHVTAPRTRLLGGLLLIGAVFYALGGPMGFSILVPVVYVSVVGGVGYLLHEWLRVFPRNPLARATGYVLLSVAILLSCVYNLRAYFVAWPHNPTTSVTFHERL